MRARLGNPNASIRATAIERLEVYSKPSGRMAPIHIHIHGGAWRQRPATEYGFPAEMLRTRRALRCP